jgi:hypothetical protein
VRAKNGKSDKNEKKDHQESTSESATLKLFVLKQQFTVMYFQSYLITIMKFIPFTFIASKL